MDQGSLHVIIWNKTVLNGESTVKLMMKSSVIPWLWPEFELEEDPFPELEVEPDVELEVELDVEPEAKPVVEPEVQPEVEPEVEPNEGL